MCDKLIYDLSTEIEGSPNIFVKKDWINILDDMNGNYGSNQSVISTSQLSNSNKYMSYREAYLAVPMLLTLASTTPASNVAFLPATAGTSADYAFGLKNWFGSIVHSITAEYNGVTVIQQTPLINMWNSFKLLTSLSWNDVIVNSASLGFFPDDALSFSFESVAALSGAGTCNNTNYVPVNEGFTVDGAFNSFRSRDGNKGFRSRQSYINYDVDGVSGDGTYAGLLTAASSAQLWKSYVSQKRNGVNAGVAGVIQISVQAQIMLKHLHSFFASMPLLKGAFLKITLNLNNCSTAISQVAGVMDLTSVSNSVGGINPLMIASRVANNGGVCLGATTYRANVSVGNTCLDSAITSLVGGVGTGTLSRNVFLYIPAYSFSPDFERAYLSNPVKQISYTDVYQYQITNIPAGGTINSLLTNGIAGLKSSLLIPFYSSAVAGTGLPLGIPVYQSPFDDAGTGPTSPLCLLTNYNVVVSGQNMIYNTQSRAFEDFMNQLVGQNAVNGNLTDGLTSGLISQQDFEMKYCYHYCDISRMLPIEESVPKAVQIIGQNLSAKAIDLICFLEYGVSISVDVLTGSRV
jgi:hypothetical protein